MRREWIEIPGKFEVYVSANASPSMRREWIEIAADGSGGCDSGSLPPCGGSGLKWHCVAVQGDA